MNYQAFTNDSLAMMHHGARGALAVDDEMSKLGAEPRFKVRTTSDWAKHAADLEAEMIRRGMGFVAIDWSMPASSGASPMLPASDAPALGDPQPPDVAADRDVGANVDKAAEHSTRFRTRIASVLKVRPAPVSSS